MPLTEIAVATGALLTGIKAYRKYRRKQIVNRFLVADNPGIQRPEDTPLASALEEVKDVLYDFAHNTVVPTVKSVQAHIRNRLPMARRSVKSSQDWVHISHQIGRHDVRQANHAGLDVQPGSAPQCTQRRQKLSAL